MYSHLIPNGKFTIILNFVLDSRTFIKAWAHFNFTHYNFFSMLVVILSTIFSLFHGAHYMHKH
jgi:hypothetical protein